MQLFSNTFVNKDPVVFDAQGALISWSKTSASQAANGLGTVKTLSNSAKVFTCTTQVQVTYQRAVQTIYPIGGSQPLQLLGSPKGSLRITTLIGPTASLQTFLKDCNDNCNNIHIAIQPFGMQASNCGESPVMPVITLSGCRMISLGISIQAAQQGLSMVNVPLSFQFTSLQWTQTQKPANAGKTGTGTGTGTTKK